MVAIDLAFLIKTALVIAFANKSSFFDLGIRVYF